MRDRAIRVPAITLVALSLLIAACGSNPVAPQSAKTARTATATDLGATASPRPGHAGSEQPLRFVLGFTPAAGDKVWTLPARGSASSDSELARIAALPAAAVPLPPAPAGTPPLTYGPPAS